MTKLAMRWTVLAVVATWTISASAQAQNRARQGNYQKLLQQKLEAKVNEMMEASAGMIPAGERWTCEVAMQESADNPGTVDSEIRASMPPDAFKAFAPVALLEAVAVPHHFPTGKITVLETTTRRVGSIDYRVADPLAAKYLTGRPKAVEAAIAEVNKAMVWH